MNNRGIYTNKKGAFTIVELMLLLVVLSLVIASSISIVTRKHKLVARKTVHGQYICFRHPQDGSADAGKLHEIMFSGKSKLRDRIEGDGSGFTKCTFEAPRNASYLYIQILGGGGAGGNADYFPQQLEVTTSAGRLIPLFGNKDNPGKEYGSNHVTKYPATSYYKHVPGVSDATPNDGVIRGATPLTVENTYRVKSDGSLNTIENSKYYGSSANEGDPLFTKELFLHLMKNKLKLKVFAYDVAGGGETGASYLLQYFKGSAANRTDLCTCKTDSSGSYPVYTASSCRADCLAAGKVSDDSETCLNVGGDDVTIEKECPAIKRFANPWLDGTPDEIHAGYGGIGTAFSTKLYDYDFYTYPVLGQLYSGESIDPYNPNLLSHATMDWRPPLGSPHCDSPNMVEFSVCAISSDQEHSYAPTYEKGSVTPGTFITPCTSGNCLTINEVTYEAQNNINGSKVRVFDVYPVYTAGTVTLPTNSTGLGKGRDGGYPFFDDNPSNGGVKLHYGQNAVTGVQKYFTSGQTSPNIWKSGATDPRGKGGKDIDSSTVSYFYNENGTKGNYTSDVLSGESGDSEFIESSRLACATNIGVYINSSAFSADEIAKALNLNTCKSDNYSSGGNASIIASFSYGDLVLSYGEQGGAGGYQALFARSFNSSTIEMDPGSGGAPAAITHDEDDEAKKGDDGGSTVLKFNCSGGGVCTGRIEVAGGFGGRSRIWDPAIHIIRPPRDLKTIVDRITASSLAISRERVSTQEPGELSKFQEVSNLLDIPDVSGVDLTLLGQGGKGGYVKHKCAILPQYFTITNWPTTRNILDNETSIGANGYTRLDESMITRYCRAVNTGSRPADEGNPVARAYSTLDYTEHYEEVKGGLGQPGAVIITW